MTIPLIYRLLGFLNRFPYNDVASDTLSPSTILEGRLQLDMILKSVDFVSYALVHIGTTNTTRISCLLKTEIKASNDSGGY